MIFWAHGPSWSEEVVAWGWGSWDLTVSFLGRISYQRPIRCFQVRFLQVYFFTIIVSQLWSISLLKTSCCLATEDTRSVVWMGVVATISAQDRLIISEPGKMTLQ